MKNVAMFEGAARAFVDVLSRVSPEQWDEPGLGVWTVRGLAGHTSRAILTVSEYLSAEPPETTSCPDAESYFLGLHDSSVGGDAVAARGVAAGVQLGDDPHRVVASSLDRTLATIASQPENRVLAVIGGRTIPLVEYLRTRTFELVVHTMDLARAVGVSHYLPVEAVSDAAALAARIAALSGRGEAVLFALTGRQPLPDGFSVV